MKTVLRAVVFMAFLLGLWGCDSLSSRVRDKFTPAPPQIREFAAEQKAVYEAARTTLLSMGFRMVSGGAAQGKLDAVSGLQSNDSLSAARQVIVKVRMDGGLDGGTEVQVWMTEVVEDSFHGSGGFGTEARLKASPLYEVLFRGIQTGLGLTDKS